MEEKPERTEKFLHVCYIFEWQLEAEYLACALVNFILTISPKRIIMGGGIMQQEQLFPLIRKNVFDKLKGYVKVPEVCEQINDYIIPPNLGDKAGVLGAIALAKSKKI